MGDRVGGIIIANSSFALSSTFNSEELHDEVFEI